MAKVRVNLTVDEVLWGRVGERSERTGASKSWLVESGLRLLLGQSQESPGLAVGVVASPLGGTVDVEGLRDAQPSPPPPKLVYRCRCPKVWASDVMCPDCRWKARPA